MMKLYHVQVIDTDRFDRLDTQQRMRTQYIPAPRGTIVASDGTPLAADLAGYDLIADPTIMNDKLRAVVRTAGRSLVPIATISVRN